MVKFGNSKRKGQLEISDSNILILANVGHMNIDEPLEIEKRKVHICSKYGVDIIADNSITSKSYEFKKWILDNYTMKLNTVPVYECFEAMNNGSFQSEDLVRIVGKHVDIGVDMIVVHPGITSELIARPEFGDRTIPITSRGGAQIFNYMAKNGTENPYFEKWEDICELVSDTGVSIAVGLSFRSGSIFDEMNSMMLLELEVIQNLIERGRKYNIPFVIEGIGHCSVNNLFQVISYVKEKCKVPIKTLGPVLSDRTCGMDHISALIGGALAAKAGASIIGALFRSEHLGLPSIGDFEESLKNYSVLKYTNNLMNDRESLHRERLMNEARLSRDWEKQFEQSLYPEIAKEVFYGRNKKQNSEKCTMCEERCALRLVEEGMCHK